MGLFNTIGMSKISYFHGNIRNTKPTKVMELQEFLNCVKFGEFKQQQLEIASIEDKTKRRKRKAEILPYVTISGVFQTRGNSSLLAHSGFIAMDFDSMDDFEEARKTLIADPYTYALFNSVSGKGFCVLTKITPEQSKHLAHFNWLSRYYYEKYGFVIDSSCKDVSRARFASYDPDLFINEKSKKAGVKQEKKTKPKTINFIATDTQMDRIVSDICSRGVNITESYEEYLRAGMAIASEFGEGGRQYFHAVSSMSSKYNQKECDKKYNNLLKSNTRVNIGTFFYMAKHAGVELFTKEESKAQHVAQTARKSNLTKEGAVKTAVEVYDIAPGKAEEAVNAVFSAETDIYQPDENTPIIEQLTTYIDLNHKFRKNEVTRVIEDDKREIDDQFVNTIYIKSKALIGNKVTKTDIESIINSDRTELFNPFKDFYEKHKHLPSKPEVINEFISTIESDTPDAASWVRKWLVGIPAAIDGDVVRTVLVLCGGQNTGKTTWFRWILPRELRKYYAESRLDREKDDELAMTQNLIIMDDEFGGKSRKDAEKFKELVSKETFFLREPYGRRNIHIKRLAMLCGTSNPVEVINDPTGNTRIIPVNVTSINHALNESIDRIQLFIELWRAWESGESWKFSAKDIENLEQIGAKHEEINYERELLLQFFEPGNDFLTATAMKNHIETHSSHKILSINKFSREVGKVFEKKKIKGFFGCYVSKLDKDGNLLPLLPQNDEEQCPY